MFIWFHFENTTLSFISKSKTIKDKGKRITPSQFDRTIGANSYSKIIDFSDSIFCFFVSKITQYMEVQGWAEKERSFNPSGGYLTCICFEKSK